MEKNKTNSIEDIKKFLSKNLSIPAHRISDEMSLHHDLGVDGEDAEEFLAEFSREFDVNLKEFNFVEYFGGDSSPTPWGFVKEAVTKSNLATKKRLEIRHLLQAVIYGELSSKTISHN